MKSGYRGWKHRGVDISPAGASGHQPAPTSRPRAVAGALAPLLTASAAAATFAGVFLPLVNVAQSYAQGTRGPQRSVEVFGTFTVQITQPDGHVDSAPWMPLGVPMLLAVAALVAGMVVAVRRPGSPLARWVMSAVAAFDLGVALTVGSSLFAFHASGPDDFLVEATPGFGLVLTLAGAVLAVAAAVCTHLARPKTPLDMDAVLAEAETPPSGVAITVLPPEPRPAAPWDTPEGG